MATGHMKRWWNSVGRPYHTDKNDQNIHKVGVTEYGIELLSCVFQCSSKGPQSYNMYKNLPLGFLMLFCHLYIDAPQKLPQLGAFSTLGTALVPITIVVAEAHTSFQFQPLNPFNRAHNNPDTFGMLLFYACLIYCICLTVWVQRITCY